MEFELKSFILRGPQRADSSDGVSVYSVDRFHIRYARPDRYCDIYTESVLRDNHVTGAALSVSKASHWVMADGSSCPILSQERAEMKEDLCEAWKVLGSPTYRIHFE